MLAASTSSDPLADVWTPPRLWPGETIFVLGGGPSLRGFDAEPLRGRRIIAVNEACKLCPFADALVFIDNSWFIPNEALVRAWPGLAITGSIAAKKTAPDKLLRVVPTMQPGFGSGPVRAGRSSGHLAVSIAVALGAARIVLLGFDMRIVDGRSHFHDSYRTEEFKLYRDDFAPSFKGWHEQALAVGCEIVNATPGSALSEFPMVDLDAELAA